MNWFRGVITRRLALNFALLALLTIGTVLLASLAVSGMSAGFTAAQARNNLSAMGSQIRSENLILINLVQRHIVTNCVQNESPEVIETQHLALEGAMASQRLLLNQLIEQAVEQTSPGDLEERTKLAQIQERVVNLNLQINRLMAAHSNEIVYGPRTHQELEILISNYEIPLQQAITDFQDYEAQRLLAAQDEVNQLKQRTLVGMVLLGLSSAVLAGIMTARSFKYIVLPLARLHRGVEKLRQGNLDETLPVESTDEIGILAATLNHMKAQLQRTLGGLEKNIRQLEQTQVALQASEAHYRTLFNGVPVGLYRSSPSGQVLDANDMFVNMLGYPNREALLATQAYNLYLNPEDRLHWQKQVEAEGGVRQFEARMRRYDGSIIWGRENSSMVKDENGVPLYFEGSIEDITARRRAEEDLMYSNTRLAALDAVSQVLATIGREPQQALQLVAQRIGELLDDVCCIHLLDEKHQVAEPVALFHPNPGILATMRETMRKLPLEGSLIQRAIENVQPLRLAPVDIDDWKEKLRSEMGSVCEDMADGGVLLAPIKAQGRSFGVVSLARRLGQPEFADKDQAFVQELAERVAMALLNAHLIKETERRLRYVEALRDIDVAITSSLDLKMTLSIMLEQVQTQLGVDAAAVFLISPHSQVLSYAAGRGFRAGAYSRTRVRIGEALAGLVALRREILSLPILSLETSASRLAAALDEEGFVTYYGAPLIAKGQAKGVLEIFHRSPLQPDDEWVDFLETLARQAAIALDNANMFSELQRSNAELVVAYDATIEGWSHALDLRDRETEGHTQRVADLTERLAHTMGMSDSELVHIRRGALLHDIGKMGIPDQILHKPGSLNEEEWEIMRQHPKLAYDMLSPVVYLHPVLDIPYCHHENWDGTGYPRGLKGEQIPLSARLFSVADVWDAITSDRPYRPAWGYEKAVEYIKSESGKKFDPQVVAIFLRMIA